MKNYWKPILTLAILSPLLAEVLSGSTPLPYFIQPVTFLLFVTIGYGFPVLIIREIVVRKGWGLIQMFFLGFGYGIYNEGLFSRTIFSPYHSPGATFSVYGLIAGARIPWLLSIASWHALFAVIFPIVIVQYLFPASANKPWLNLKAAWIIGLLGIAVGVSDFLGQNGFPESGGVGYLVFIFLCWLALLLLAWNLPRTPRIASTEHGYFSWEFPGIGLGLFALLYLVPLAFSIVQVPLVLFALYFLIVFFLLIRRFSKISDIPLSSMMLIALGGEVGLAVFSFGLSLLTGVFVETITVVIFFAFFLWAFFRLKKAL